MKKRILSAFLCLCMMLTLAPAAFASNTGGTNDIEVELVGWGTTDDTVTADYDTGTKKITIGGTIEKDTFTEQVTEVKVKLTFNNTTDFPSATPCEIVLKPSADNTTITVEVATGNSLPAEYGLADTHNIKFATTGGEGTGGEGGNEPTTPTVDATALTVAAAPLEDHAKTNPIAKDKLFKTYELVANPTDKPATVQGKTNEFTQTLTISGTDLVRHTNAQEEEGYWVGFFAAAPQGADNLLYTKEGQSGTVEETKFDTVAGKAGISVYYDREKVKNDTCTLEWRKAKAPVAREATVEYETIAKVTYTVNMEEVHYAGEPTTPAKDDYTVTVGMDETYASHTLTAKIGDAVNGKFPITFSGKVPEAAFTDATDKKTASISLKFLPKGGADKDAIIIEGKIVLGDDGKITLSVTDLTRIPDIYSIENEAVTEITIAKADVPDNVEPTDPVVSDSEGIDNKEDADAAKVIAGTVAAADTEMEKIASDNDTLNTVADEAKKAGNTVEVFIEVKATGYEKDDNGNVASVKLDITPKYQVKKGATNVGEATALTVTKPITLTVTLPSSFENALNVFAKHLDASGNEKDRYKVTMDGTTGKFTTDGFSEFEFTKDERTVTVHYYGISQKDTAYYPVNYTAVNIDSKHLMKHSNSNKTDEEQFIDTPVGESGPLADYTFKGWSTKENDTNVEYEAGALLTTTIFDKLYNAATNGVEQLYPVFVKEGSSDKPSGGNTGSSGSGGGGGSKRPSSSTDKDTTTPTVPSDYGDNPSDPSTPTTPVSSTGFSDVVAGGWYESAVQYMKDNGLMAGTSATTFAPDATTTRGMIVTILYRLEKEPEAAASTFSDIAAGEWYSNAVAWAAANNIVSGYENGTFGANDVITREQMAAILFRYASFKGYDVTKTADISSFADAAQVSAYAADAMKWANAAGLISGTSATTLAPTGSATRAQAASILMRFCENVAK